MTDQQTEPDEVDTPLLGVVTPEPEQTSFGVDDELMEDADEHASVEEDADL